MVCRHCADGDFHRLDDQPDQWLRRGCERTMPRCDRCHSLGRALLVTAEQYRLCRPCTRTMVGCASCRRLTDPALRTDTGVTVCSRCAAAFFDACSECGHYTAASRYVSGNERACSRCAASYASCTGCGTLLRPGHGCDRCRRGPWVWNYTYKPDPVFHGEGPLFLGLELEIIVPEDDHRDCVAEATRQLGTLGYLKRDSSIRPSGFELVTHPMSYRYAIERFPWLLLDELDARGCETDSSVGLHVHASRAGFDSPAHIYRWLKLLYRNESAVTRLARRRSHYAPFDHLARAKARDTAKSHQHALGLDRHQAINVYPRHTLELRVFASSLDRQSVQAALAFTAASIDYTRSLRVTDIRAGAWEWQRFAAWATARPDYAPLVAEMEELACAC
ncbi:hypothetical protein [Nocardia sp. NPDC057227]|uniref:hypothetical protein n=1 Tax=Nocardia sp. NPDC057227 TaxID=3346056 RepID=UPI003637917C